MYPDVPAHILAWYDDLIKVAIEKYHDGWDWIVECEDAYDLKREVENHGLTDWHQVLEHYTVAVANRKDRLEDIQAEADDGEDWRTITGHDCTNGGTEDWCDDCNPYLQ
jgi:hypothetical protein